jgi:hypothetical protein
MIVFADIFPSSGFEKDKMTLPVQQITVHTVDDLGCPLHFGMRMTPKLTSLARGDLSYYGLEVVVFAELWFRNFTDLPICFGCPWSQIRPLDVFESEVTDELSILESASKAAAESTLQEIASIFEFGEKGKELKGEDRGLVDRWNIYNVPLQSCELVCHEVFEYIEVDASTVKRRWWASEQYDSLRKPTTQYKDRGSYWEWIDDSWVSCQVSMKMTTRDLSNQIYKPELGQFGRCATLRRSVGELSKSQWE